MHEGCMHPDYCMEPRQVPRPIATLHVDPTVLPLRLDVPAAREHMIHDLEHLAEMLSMWCSELRKGEHSNTAHAVFYARLQGLGPHLVVRVQQLAPQDG